jgi:hypothetical protein
MKLFTEACFCFSRLAGKWNQYQFLNIKTETKFNFSTYALQMKSAPAKLLSGKCSCCDYNDAYRNSKYIAILSSLRVQISNCSK